MNLKEQVLASINFGSLTAIVVAAGLALVGLAFLSFVLNLAQGAASGNVGETHRAVDDDDDYKDSRND